MHHTDVDDFKKEVTKNGFDIMDFELDGVDLTNWQPNQLVKKKGSVTVTRKTNQKQKAYNTGHGTRWVADFSNDLKAGVFN